MELYPGVVTVDKLSTKFYWQMTTINKHEQRVVTHQKINLHQGTQVTTYRKDLDLDLDGQVLANITVHSLTGVYSSSSKSALCRQVNGKLIPDHALATGVMFNPNEDKTTFQNKIIDEARKIMSVLNSFYFNNCTVYNG